MIDDVLESFYRFLGLLILITLCSSTGDLQKAEAVTAKVDTPAESKFSCAIAKSAYGAPSFDAPVNRIRAFRDRVLRQSDLGRLVVKSYYHFCGFLLPYLDGDGLSERSLRWTIRAFLYFVEDLETVGPGAGVVLLALVLGRRGIRAKQALSLSSRRS